MRWRMPDGKLLRAAIPWAVLAAALVLTASGWLAHERARASHARGEFKRRGDAVAGALAARMESYALLLQACAARVASGTSLTPAKWRAFVGYLDLPHYYPALQSLTYSRDPGAASSSDAVRRAAILLAHESGVPAISGKVMLAHGDVAGGEAGFAIVAPLPRDASPVYAGGLRAAPRAAWVSGDVRIYDLLRGMLDARTLEVLDLRIYDGERVEPAAVLVDTRTESTGEPRFERTVVVRVPGRAWTLQFLSQPEFDQAFERDRAWGLLAAGVAASFLAFFLARALAHSFDRAHHLSMRDPLTGLFNRRYLDETMEREMERARREGASVGVIVLDIDHFKRLNDTFGHDAGDHVLARVGELLRHLARGSDIACRFGGEEFALILPGATLAVSAERAEAIRALFEATPFEFDGRRIPPMTLSAGVSALAPGDGDWGEVLHHADRALYAAKQAGRNRVIVGSNSGVPFRDGAQLRAEDL
jgi:diguanylate cyclase (GGDEF)-like protein